MPRCRGVRLYVGGSSGPEAFKSELGKQICNISNPDISYFPSIPNPEFFTIPTKVPERMSQDQKLLYKACQAVISGFCPVNLAHQTLGPVNHSRWLTTGLRILFVYMSHSCLPHGITRLANFVIHIYARLYFDL